MMMMISKRVSRFYASTYIGRPPRGSVLWRRFDVAICRSFSTPRYIHTQYCVFERRTTYMPTIGGYRPTTYCTALSLIIIPTVLHWALAASTFCEYNYCKTLVTVTGRTCVGLKRLIFFYIWSPDRTI